MKKKVNLKQLFYTIILPIFCAGLLVQMYYRFFDFSEATKNLLQISLMLNFCLSAVLIAERHKKQKEEKEKKTNLQKD